MAAFIDQILIECQQTRVKPDNNQKCPTRTGHRSRSAGRPRAPLPTDIIDLRKIGNTSLRLLEVCAAACLLDDDREPAVDKWFKAAIAELPEQMRNELDRWYAIMISGSSTPPRSKPRSEQTITTWWPWA